MNSDIKLSVREILENKNFRDSELIAGKTGLHRQVKWVHIMEVTEITTLLNGGELILSTGVGWKGNKNVFLAYFNQLIDCGAAGLCIELGTYIPYIPAEIVDLANLHHFPLIVFNNTVRFVDITQDIHTLIIKKHYQMITDLEHYSHQLNQLLLTSNPKQKILKLLHEHLKMSVFYLSKQEESQILSKIPTEEQGKILQLSKENNLNIHLNIAHQSIQAFNQKLADLIIVSDLDSITEYESLILDRSATALAQNIMRELYIEERRKTQETEWVQEWLDGGQSEEQIYRLLTDFEPGLKANGCVVLLLKNYQIDGNNPEITHLTILSRSIFESLGFFLLSNIRKNEVTFILINKRKNNDWKLRVNTAIDQIQKARADNQKFDRTTYCVGRFTDKLDELKRSYQTAKETLIIQEKMPRGHFSHFYEDLYIYRIIERASVLGILDDFISDYLGPVLTYDDQNNGKLKETLKTYLQCNGSKKETAANLFIVRQTLYQRLDKLYELIGKDFMESHKRQALEFAIRAYDYVSASKSLQ